MTGVLRFVRFSIAQRPPSVLDSSEKLRNCVTRRFLATSTAESPARVSKMKVLLIAAAVGGSIGTGYSFYQRKNLKNAILNPDGEGLPVVWKELPAHKVSRKVVGPNKSLELVLFQYPTCPFCCKVRAFLDYNGLSYDVIEVNPLRKTQMKWSEYKKVPVLLVKVDNGYLQLNDSSVIVSVLSTYLHEPTVQLTDLVKYFPNIAFMDDDGTIKKEVLNKYHVMYGGIPDSSNKNIIAEERQWRKWVDNVLVHMLSPNVYRTRAEAVESFEWFSKVGEWDKNFSPFEVTSIIQLGSGVMWMLGKRLKKKYNLKEDVRESLYDTCNNWLKLLRTKGTQFHGGSHPDLADLAVYGALNSIEGCSAFTDLRKNTKISIWYDAVKQSVELHEGFSKR